MPGGLEPPALWRKCLDDLHGAYGGVCGYLAVYIERATGAASVDHYVAKSVLAGKTYEWDNYRLACLAMNARKRAFDDVLDPVEMPTDVFRLELTSGRIHVNARIAGNLKAAAKLTIERLKLDAPLNREMRTRHIDEYLELKPIAPASARQRLARYSPFVWAEVLRQGL